jgi:hypothetical protein
MRERADRLNDYFLAALKAYAFKDDEEAGFAAFAVAATANGMQRSGMVALTQRIAADLECGFLVSTLSEAANVRLIVAKLRILAQMIASRDWNLADAFSARRHLWKVSRVYFDALGRVDPSVFHQCHPEIFSDSAKPPVGSATGPFCSACGASVAVQWRFCEACGAPQPSLSAAGA